MIRLSINLPAKHKLHLNLVKRRGDADQEPLIPSLGRVRRAKKGSKFSRFFKYIFEHKSAKKLFGINAAFMVIASSLVPQQISGKEFEQIVVQTTETPLSTKKAFRYPVDDVKISQGYNFFHPAYDLDGITGEPIYPIKNGIVEAVEYSRFAYGNAIYINHGNGLISLYAHLSKIDVEKGDKVTTAEVIGEMGNTGRSFGDHLHLEIIENGYSLNPYTVLPR